MPNKGFNMSEVPETVISWVLGLGAALVSLLLAAWGYIFHRKVKILDGKVDKQHFDSQIQSIKDLMTIHKNHLDKRIDSVEDKFDKEHRITRSDITQLVKAMMNHNKE